MQITMQLEWTRENQTFVDNRYCRVHTWRFDGGARVLASSSPHIVPVPMSAAYAVDPEEAFVASLSSCHMLWFLSIVAKQGFVVDRYEDDAEGTLAKNTDGKQAITQVLLRPLVVFSGERTPTQQQINELHRAAHDACFIANSVRTEVLCQPRFE